ncbi:MAG: isochorismatase family protein [Bacteroidota bacterium]|nr:isochorismatase family protein [Bacteroidota bacterium]
MKSSPGLPKKIRPALLIIDVQNVYLWVIPQRDKELAIYFINLLIDLFRKNEFPVIRIYHHNEENGPRPYTEEFEYPDQISIKQEDTQIIKTYSDSFNKTSLDQFLKEKGINTLFLCGLSAVGCVLATRTGANNHDYKSFLVRDAIMSHNSEYTRNVEAMFDAISYDAVKLIVESSERMTHDA